RSPRVERLRRRSAISWHRCNGSSSQRSAEGRTGDSQEGQKGARPVSPIVIYSLPMLLAVTASRAPDTSEPPDRATSWSFRNNVIPVLTKAGCNGGACHGALAGKGGLKLTLRGFD